MCAWRWIYLTFDHWGVQAALDISNIRSLKVNGGTGILLAVTPFLATNEQMCLLSVRLMQMHRTDSHVTLLTQLIKFQVWKYLIKQNGSLTLVDLQLDTQNSYLFTCNTFIKILYMYQALPCSSSGSLCHNCVHAHSGIVTLCRDCLVHRLTGTKDSHLQRVIPEAAYIQLQCKPPEDE
jgi:hypothetical protein